MNAFERIILYVAVIIRKA